MNTSNVVIAAMIPIAVKVTLLLGVVAIADLLVLRRVTSAAVRHLVWTVATAGALLLPLLGAFMPTLRVPVRVPLWSASASPALEVGPPPQNAGAVAAMPRNDIVAPQPASASGASRFPTMPRASAPARDGIWSHWSALTIVLIVYALGVVLVIASLALERLFVRRLLRDSALIEVGPWVSSLHRVAVRAGGMRQVRLLRSNSAILPLTARVFDPVVLVPKGSDMWTDERRDAVLLHELAHVSRFDCLTQTLAAISCAVYWPHPLAWWAAARLRAERELACDDLVIARGMDAHAYAQHLLEIARTFAAAARVPTLAVSMAAPSNFEQRLRAIIDSRRHRGAVGRRSVAIASLAVIATVAPLAATAPAEAREMPDTAGHSTLTPTPPAAIVNKRVDSASAENNNFAAEIRRRSGRFRVRLTRAQEGGYAAGTVHVSLYSPGLNTFYVDERRLNGLAAGQLEAPSGKLAFTLKRDAGSLIFSGAMRGQEGEGEFTFVPDPTFAAALARRGVGEISEEQQYVLGLHDLPLAFLDELARQGYETPSVAELVRASVSSVDSGFVRQMGKLGYRVKSLSTLIGLSNVGVDPLFIAAQMAAGRRGLSIAELRALRMNGDAETRAPSSDSPAQPVTDAGRTALTGRWKVTARADGSLKLDIDWADVNQWSRLIAPGELAGITPADIMATGNVTKAFRYEQDAGRFEFRGTFDGGRGAGEFTFTPNREYSNVLRALGIVDLDVLTDHELKNLAFSGVSAQAVRQFKALGYNPLTRRQLVDIAVRQVTPEYARSLQEAHVPGADSMRVVLERRFTGFRILRN